MGNLLSPAKAYELAKNGQFLELKKYYISPNFTWGEVFTNCRNNEIGEFSLAVFNNAKRQSHTMEIIRGIFGDRPIIVTSWVRSKKRNALVNGASNSRHLYGDGTDFEIVGYQSIQGNYKVQKILDPLPFMQKCGLEYTGGRWTHVDSRGAYARFTA